MLMNIRKYMLYKSNIFICKIVDTHTLCMIGNKVFKFNHKICKIKSFSINKDGMTIKAKYLMYKELKFNHSYS